MAITLGHIYSNIQERWQNIIASPDHHRQPPLLIKMCFIFHVCVWTRCQRRHGGWPASMSARQLTDTTSVDLVQRPSWQASGGIIDGVVVNCIYLCLWRENYSKQTTLFLSCVRGNQSLWQGSMNLFGDASGLPLQQLCVLNLAKGEDVRRIWIIMWFSSVNGVNI